MKKNTCFSGEGYLWCAKEVAIGGNDTETMSRSL
jgi:hypothetical protein